MFTYALRGRIQKVYQLQNDPQTTKITLIPDADPPPKLRKDINEKLSLLDIYVPTSQLDGLPLNPHVAIQGRGFYATHKAKTRDGRDFWAHDLRLSADRVDLIDATGALVKPSERRAS